MITYCGYNSPVYNAHKNVGACTQGKINASLDSSPWSEDVSALTHTPRPARLNCPAYPGVKCRTADFLLENSAADADQRAER